MKVLSLLTMVKHLSHCRQLVLALGVEQNQLKSIRNKIQEVNWQRKQEQVQHHYDIIQHNDMIPFYTVVL